MTHEVRNGRCSQETSSGHQYHQNQQHTPDDILVFLELPNLIMPTINGNNHRHRPRVNIVNSFQGSVHGFTDNWVRAHPSDDQTSDNQSRIPKTSLRRRFGGILLFSLAVLFHLELLPRLRILSLLYDYYQKYVISGVALLFQSWQTWDWGTVVAASIDVVILEGEGKPFDKAWDSFTSVDEVLYSWPVWWMSSEKGHFFGSTGKLKVATPCEIPLPLFNAIQADSSSALAHHYRLWIRNEWFPGVQLIADIILRSGHLLEALPTSQLRRIYNEPPTSKGNWKWTARGMFFSMWLSYTRAWDTILQEWDDKNYCRIRPTMPFPCGIFMFVVHGQSIVADLQKELTGQSQMHGSRGINVNDA